MQATGLYQRYLWNLHNRPFITNAYTSSVIVAFGDALAQKLYPQNDKWDMKRTFVMFLWGFCYAGPLQTLWFRGMDKLFGTERTLYISLKKIFVTISIWGTTSNVLFYTYVKVCGHYHQGVEEVKHQVSSVLRNEVPRTAMVSVGVWPLIQLVNFTMVPIHFRTIWVSTWNVGWNCFTSFLGHRSHGTQAPITSSIHKEGRVIPFFNYSFYDSNNYSY